MFAISTCWKSSLAESGDEIIQPILDAGFTAVELEYRITEDIFRELLSAFRREELSAVSVHNFFPLPLGLKREQASGDAFLLSSPEKEERGRAVRYTLRTLECAHDIGASAVVLHMGKTAMDDQFAELAEEREKGKLPGGALPDRAKNLVQERRREGKKHIDAALFSLDKLWKPAERFGIKLGVENRYLLHEVPNADELEIILDRFEGSSIGYWHDVGHAAVQEFLYGIGHEEQLSRFSPRMIGVHLHDADGVNDHRAPGKGKVDFSMVGRFLRPETIQVIEPASDVNEEDLTDGMMLLADILK